MTAPLYLAMEICDSHSHIVVGDERLTVLSSARPADWPRVLLHHGPIALGIHPWYAEDATPENLAVLAELLRSRPDAWVGECGLDGSPSELQLAAFSGQVRLAAELSRPLVVHIRKAWSEFEQIIAPYPDQTVILHSYCGSAEQITQWERKFHQWYYSFGRGVLGPNSNRLIKAVAAVPLERLLLESDYDGKCQRPELAAILAKLAAIRNIPPHQLATILNANWRRCCSFAPQI